MARPPSPRTTPEPPPVPGARWIPLTRAKFALVDEEDFDRISPRTWSYIKVCGIGYAKREEDVHVSDGIIRVTIFMQQDVLRVSERVTIDHKSLDGLDNRKGNLRLCTRSQNQQNQRLRKDNTSGYKGVCWHKVSSKWWAKITVSGSNISLGLFSDVKDAARAYNEAAKKHFGEFARINEL